MERNADNVILFPKWKETLKQDSLHALEQNEYESALIKLEELLAYDERDHEMITGKVLCLMELNRFHEAQKFCEKMLQYRDENYYQYFHLYLTILFQTSQYRSVMEYVEDALNDASIPEEITETLQQLYTVSENMQQEQYAKQSHYYVEELIDAIDKKAYQKQWYTIEQLKRLHIAPPEKLYVYLTDDDIHPVVKTNLFQWLQESQVNDYVNVIKESEQLSVQPASFPPLHEHTTMKQVLFTLREQEQKNPTLFYLMEQLLKRYLYVCYPALPPVSDVEQIASALKILGERYVQDKLTDEVAPDVTVKKYMDKMEKCEKLYLSILDD